MADPVQHLEKKRRPGELSTWGEAQAKLYETAKHGPDGRTFLDNHLYETLRAETINGKAIADIGAGAGPWSEYAHGLAADHVVCLDLNPAMVERAKARWADDIRPDNIEFMTGNAASLPLSDASQDVVLSINVGCNLPEVGNVFQRHFEEAYRVAKSGAEFVVTAPDSLTTVFTDGADPTLDDLQTKIDQLWDAELDHSVAGAKKIIASLEHCLRATFILDAAGKPIVITDANVDLVKPGDPIIRKIPGLAVDNNYHTAAEYRAAAEAAGWTIAEEHNESFPDETARTEHNSTKPDDQLGKEYVGKPPFLFMVLTK